jgi:hypothetical protein
MPIFDRCLATRHRVKLALVAAGCLTAAGELPAQAIAYDGGTPKTRVRQRGDTVWMMSDTLTIRTERRGDTIVVMTMPRGRPATRLPWVIRGDSAYLRRADGKVLAAPAFAVNGIFRVVEGMRRVDAMRSRYDR